MKITVDTNILVRAVVRDDERQARTAAKLLKEAELIAVTLPCLCEFVWVLRRVYNFGQQDISAALEALLNAGNVAVNRPAADAGLAVLNEGGDFADGLIAYEGNWLGGETFVSFDKKAVSLIVKQGQQAKLLA
jgi:predicted nucleic-acid-binding protein